MQFSELFWIKNGFFIAFIVIVLHAFAAIWGKDVLTNTGIKNKLVSLGLVEKAPRDSPLGLNINSFGNKRYLAKLKDENPLDQLELPTMLKIKSGTVTMGCIGSEQDCIGKIKADSTASFNKDNKRNKGFDGFELPETELKRVDVTAFQIAETETTVEQWDLCVAHGGCDHMPDNYNWGRGDLPVVNVSWTDVQQYLSWLNSVTVGGYRLPTNAEWEYAAKASTTTRFPWGDELPECDKVRHGSPPWMPKKTHRCQNEGTWSVKSKEPNPWGLYHVIGNAAEWVSNCGNREAGCGEHINRGGNWVTEPETSVLHSRDYTTDHRYNRVGFRLARSVD